MPDTPFSARATTKRVWDLSSRRWRATSPGPDTIKTGKDLKIKKIFDTILKRLYSCRSVRLSAGIPGGLAGTEV